MYEERSQSSFRVLGELTVPSEQYERWETGIDYDDDNYNHNHNHNNHYNNYNNN